MPLLAEHAGGRADEDERSEAGAGDLAEERARSEERRGQVRADGLLPAVERELPERDVLGRVHAGDRCADVHAAERRARVLEEAIGVRLHTEIGLRDSDRADGRGDLGARSSPRW